MRRLFVVAVLVAGLVPGATTALPNTEAVPVTGSGYPQCDTPERISGNGWCQYPGVFLRLTF